MKKIGILGLGIGSMYHKILHQYFNVITIDSHPSKKADFLTLDKCLEVHNDFDLFIIATPNHLHKEHLYKVLHNSNIVLVEKPGLVFLKDWKEAYSVRQNVFMTKNNLWREEFPFIRSIITKEYLNNTIDKVKITWINKSRVPFPGHWFTEKSKSYGGTSKDSFPHLLSEFYYLFHDSLYGSERSNDLIDLVFQKEVKQNFTLDQVTDTDYGTVNQNGIYDVDDYCKIEFDRLPVEIIGCWKSPTSEDTKIGIEMILKDGSFTYFDFDLCPEYCYFKQFNYFINIDEWEKEEQYKIDCFIHSVIEKL